MTSDFITKVKAAWNWYEDFFAAHPKVFSIVLIAVTAWALIK